MIKNHFRDASEITEESLLKIEAKTKSHFLFIDLPTTKVFSLIISNR